MYTDNVGMERRADMPKKRMGRPTIENPKNMRVDVRLTEEELEMLDRYCRRDCEMVLRLSMQKNKTGSGAVGKCICTTSLEPSAVRRTA